MKDIIIEMSNLKVESLQLIKECIELSLMEIENKRTDKAKRNLVAAVDMINGSLLDVKKFIDSTRIN